MTFINTQFNNLEIVIFSLVLNTIFKSKPIFRIMEQNEKHLFFFF